MTQGFVHPEYLVDTGWLAAHLADPDVCVLDCTTHLTPLPDDSYYTVRAGREEFLGAHIPGAGLVDMDHDVADTSAPYHFMLPSAEKFADAMSALGIARAASTGLRPEPWMKTTSTGAHGSCAASSPDLCPNRP